MKCAIMQPTYLPWSGYFNLINSVDIFVFLDDVQLEKQSWQTRNRILFNGNVQLLSVPIIKSPFGSLINTIKINDGCSWRKKHIKTLESAYCNHPFSEDIIPQINVILSDQNVLLLSELNIKIIKKISSILKISTKFILSSELDCSGKRSEYILQICNALNANIYLSPVGSKDYLGEENFADKFNLEYQNFNLGNYSQLRSEEFISHLSVIDVIANVGVEKAREYITG